MSDKVYSIPEIIEIVAPIVRDYGVERVYLFGSYARGEADKNSDIDLCVDASELRGMFALGRLYADLEEAFGKKLDLLTVNSLNYNDDKRFTETVERERVLIYDAA